MGIATTVRVAQRRVGNCGGGVPSDVRARDLLSKSGRGGGHRIDSLLVLQNDCCGAEYWVGAIRQVPLEAALHYARPNASGHHVLLQAVLGFIHERIKQI